MEGLLQYIDQIDQSVADAEIDVLESLIESYDKSIMILENADDTTDLFAFDIFQEGDKWDKFKEDTKAPVFGNKGEGLIKRLAMIIPRLLQKLIALIRRLFTKNNAFEQKMDKDMQQMKKQATTVIPEPITDEQAKIIADHAKDLEKKKHAEMQAAYDKSVEEVKQTSKDLEATKNRTMDNISARHTAFWQSYDELMKSLHGSDIPTHAETKQSVSNIADSIQKIDKKNPGFADQVLEELGAPPRKKIKLEDVMIEVQGTTFFKDDPHRNEESAAMSIYTDPLVEGFKNMRDSDYSHDSINKYRSLIDEIEYEWKQMIDYVFGDQYMRKSFKVKYGDAVKTFETMKKTFENDVKNAKKSIDTISKLIPEIKSEFEKFNATVADPDRMGESQSMVLNVLKDSEVGLMKIVQRAEKCLEGWQMIWDSNYKALQDGLKNITQGLPSDIITMPLINAASRKAYYPQNDEEEKYSNTVMNLRQG